MSAFIILFRERLTGSRQVLTTRFVTQQWLCLFMLCNNNLELVPTQGDSHFLLSPWPVMIQSGISINPTLIELFWVKM